MIFVNFKTYEQGTGGSALNLTKVLEEVAYLSQVKIIPVVQAADVKEISNSSRLEIWVQKVDAAPYGAHTGAILPEAVYEDGASGTFLNHSEAKLPDFDSLKDVNKRAQEVGLKTLIFAKDITELNKVLPLRPTYVAYEPPELIGSSEVSVVGAKTEMIAEAVVISKNEGVPLIVGAGIHLGIDVKKSIELGAVGVAVSSDIVKAQDPRRELLNLVEGFK